MYIPHCLRLLRLHSTNSVDIDRLALLEIISASKIERDLAQALRGLAQSSSGGPQPVESSKTAKGKAKENHKKKFSRPESSKPSLVSLYVVLVHDVLFAKRGLQLPKDHRVKKELDKLTTR